MAIGRTSRRQFVGGTAAAATAATIGATSARAEGSVLRVRHPQEMLVIDPANTNNRAEINIVYAIYNRLVTFKPHSDAWDWQLDAAESIEQTDDTHIAFRLRPGIAWSNGFGTMTAEDVKYSFERIIDPANASPYTSDFVWLDHVDVVDDLNGVIVLKEPSPIVWTTLPWIVASIVCKKAVEAFKASSGNPLFTTDPLATSNVYRIKEWVPQQKLHFERNPDWTGAPADFDEVIAYPIDDDKSAELAFESGEIDFTEVSVSSIPTYKDSPPKGGRLIVRPATGLRWIGMNTEHPPFDDQRVRRAVQLAVNVNQILDGVFSGLAPRATGPVPPGVVGFRGYNLYPDQDVAKAKALLAEAGLADGFKTTITIENTTDMATMAQLVQSDLAQVGIEAEINALESGLFWVQGLEAEGEYWKDLQMFVHNWGFTPDPSNGSQWYTPEQIGIWNWERWNNAEYGELAAKAIKELDPAKRAEMYVRMQDLMEESGAYVFVTPGITALLVRDGIEPGTSADGRRIFYPFFQKTT